MRVVGSLIGARRGQLVLLAAVAFALTALVAAFDAAAAHTGSPSVIICDTRIGYGVPLLEQREKAHFMRVEAHEWDIARAQLDETYAR